MDQSLHAQNWCTWNKLPRDFPLRNGCKKCFSLFYLPGFTIKANSPTALLCFFFASRLSAFLPVCFAKMIFKNAVHANCIIPNREIDNLQLKLSVG